MIKQYPDLQSLQEERKIGVAGLNTVEDPADLDIKYSPDNQNVVFDSGIVTPRKGSRLFAEKPTGETQDPLQTIVANNSVGDEFLVGIFGNNFYLFDEENEWWVLLNSSYTPTETTLFYGNANWNNGLGDDSLYACNGKESFIKWPIVLQSLAADALSTDTSITVDDGVPFPSSGSLVLYDGTTQVTAAFSSKAGNVITLTGPLGTDVGAGASIAMPIEEKASMEIGKIVITYARRLMVANEYLNEIKVAYTVINDPEDFTTGDQPSDGGLLLITDGNGQLTAMGDFGEYVLITKENNIIKFQIKINDAGDQKLEVLDPVISGKGMGPRADIASIKVFNSVYYVTPSKDIYQLTPTQTGQNSTSGVTNISAPIYNYTKTLYFDACRSAYNDQKILWTCGTGETNNLVLVYDLIRNAWTKFLGWNIQDVFSKSNNFYYLDRTNGNIYEGLTDYDDDGAGYTAFFFTKRISSGKFSLPKTATAMYLEGYITSSTNLFVDVLYNEGGLLKTKTFKIQGTGSYVTQINAGALAQYPMGVIPLGLSQDGVTGIFRVYLSIPNKYGFYNLQAKIYSETAGSIWGVTGMALDAIPEKTIPALLLLDAIS